MIPSRAIPKEKRAKNEHFIREGKDSTTEKQKNVHARFDFSQYSEGAFPGQPFFASERSKEDCL